MQKKDIFPVLPREVLDNWRFPTEEEKVEHGDWADFVVRVGISIDPHHDLSTIYFPGGFYGLRRKNDNGLVFVSTFWKENIKQVRRNIKSFHEDEKFKCACPFTWEIYRSIPEINTIFNINEHNHVLVIDLPLKGPEMNDFAKFVFSFKTSWEQRDNPDGRYQVAYDSKYDGRFPRYGKMTKERLYAAMAEINGSDEVNKGFKRFWREYNLQKKKKKKKKNGQKNSLKKKKLV